MIIGHEKQLALLERFIRGVDTHHSFLFVGPESIGKKTIARSFSHRLVHNNQDAQWNIFDGSDSDIFAVSPEAIEKKNQKTKKTKKTIKDIPIDDIRDARASFALAADKHAKTLIIDDAHRMTISAQNALLKTLEEPTKKSYIVLVTHAPERLLDTIRSRCFVVQFDLLSDQELQMMFSDSPYIDDAQGRPGHLYHLHNDVDFREAVAYARIQLQGLFQQKLYERMNLAAELAKKDDQYITIFFTVWIYRIWRAAHKSKKYNLLKVAEKIEDMLQLMQRTNVNKQLVLEDLLIHIV